MKRPTPLLGIKVRKAFGFINLNRLFESRGPAAATPMAEVRKLQPSPRVLPQNPPDQGLALTEDWDIMFRAIQVRLVKAVGDRLDAAPAPAPDDAAGRVQVCVLECVTAMAQLHAALKHQRG